MNLGTYLAAQCKGVALKSPPIASTSAPCSNKYLQAKRWLLIAAQCKAVIPCKSLSFTLTLTVSSVEVGLVVDQFVHLKLMEVKVN